MELYKLTNADGTPCNGGTGVWHLPKGKRPGKWMPPIQGEIIPCLHGYHALRPQDILSWTGEALWELETKDATPLVDEDKVVLATARLVRRVDAWNDKTLRLLAADLAEHAQHLGNGDKRSRRAIVAARMYAFGLISRQELAAAWDAARAAARAAAGDAARAAVWNAARAAAWDAAWDAEKAWQGVRVLSYLRGQVDLAEIEKAAVAEWAKE